MTRYEFLKNMGLKGAALMAVMASCVKDEDTYTAALTLSASDPNNGASTGTTTPITAVIPANGTDPKSVKTPLLTLDLTATATKALQTVGGYMVQGGIVIARLNATTVIAATQTCSHEPKKKIIFNKTEYYCTDHGGRFDTNGKGLNSFGANGLTIYKIATDGKTLVVYS